MKKIILTLWMYFLFLPLTVWAFSDIESSWYKDSILELKESGVVNGYGDGRFWPEDNVTRAEILAMIFNSAWIEVPDTWEEKCFPDVENDIWYSDYICYAGKEGITKGYEDGNFKPNGSVSIIEALAFVSGIFELDVPKDDTALAWYEDYIMYAHEEKIIQKNAYSINVLGKRGQISEIISRAQKLSQWQTLDYKSQGCSANGSLSSKNTIQIDAKQRSYILELPKNYNANQAYPLVIWLHGRTNSNDMVQDYMWLMWWGWKWIEARNVISAYPAWLGTWPYTWHEAENIDFFDAMVSEIWAELCIDRSQIHIVWHSLGAYFSNKLSCLRGDVITTMTAVAWPWYDSECRGPTASLILHNSRDSLVPYSDGTTATRIRKEKNFCSWEAEKLDIWWLSCELWNGCSAGNPVAFCSEYSTYWDVPHSRPKDGAKGIYEFIWMLKD